MKTEAVELYMRCFRPETGAPRDPLFAKAMKLAAADGRLRPLVEDQNAFDQWAMDRVGEIDVSPASLAELQKALTTRSAVPSWRSPAVLSVVLGLVLIAGVVAYFWMVEMSAFDGRGEVEDMVERTARMTGGELQTVSMKLGDLDDWLFMQNLESLEVPPNLRSLTAIGARVFQQKGYPVVQLALKEQDALVFLFRPKDFGVRLQPEGDWIIFPVDDWVAAVRLTGSNAIMLAMRGNRADMQAALKALP